VFDHLQIPYREERWLVGLADAGLSALSLVGAVPGSRGAVTELPKRILLLRLERVGDLVMTLEAIATVRALAPAATIDLVVGQWNVPLARLIDSVNSVEMVDVPWLTREGQGFSWPALLTHARGWRTKRYDLGINFEPDIRSNVLLGLSGAGRRAGFVSGGGAALLTDQVEPDPTAHVSTNARTLVARAFGVQPDRLPITGNTVLTIPDSARRQAAELMGSVSPAGEAIGIQPAAGRRIKEWHPARFAEVGAELARARGSNVVMIGSRHDQPVLDAMRSAWPSNVPLLTIPPDTDLVVLAAILERLRLFITGDTGPMHLAAAVGTPVLAVFGPSLPSRYAPFGSKSRVVRIDIPCSPCNLLRKPPSRCVGHVPDCLEGIPAADVIKVAHEMLGSYTPGKDR
jgi:ADP-heptose:LPS heptosyltransferase